MTIWDIILAVAKEWGITPGQLRGPKRGRRFVVPRQVTAYLIRDLLELSYPRIGHAINRDHSTVMHSISCVRDAQPAVWQRIVVVRDKLMAT